MTTKLVKFVVRVLDALTARRKKSSEREPEHLVTGQRGEDAAYFYLREHGYVIVARNWRSRRRKGEIDLIGWDGDTLCFIEVKTRSTHDVKPAEAAVDHDKQKELRAMAREYVWRTFRSLDRVPEVTTKDAAVSSVKKKDGTARQRFDVVSVYYEGVRREFTQITLFQNAFPAF